MSLVSAHACRWKGRLPLLAAWLCLVATGTGTPLLLYSTHFEAEEGFSLDKDLAGQDGWVSDGEGGNGLTEWYLEYGQSAYIGYGPATTTNGTYLWKPINHNPTNLPVVQVAFELAVIDSSTTNRDEFRWSVYNIAGVRLFSLVFDNRDLGIYYLLDDDTFRFTGWGFTNDPVYSIQLEMEFAANAWNAWVGGVQVVTNGLITTTNASRTFGDIDAVWLPGQPGATGDNFMIFDDLAITADVANSDPAWLEPPRPVAGGWYWIRVHGPEGASLAVEASTNLTAWLPLKTNVVTGGYFDYVDTPPAGLSHCFYRTRRVP